DSLRYVLAHSHSNQGWNICGPITVLCNCCNPNLRCGPVDVFDSVSRCSLPNEFNRGQGSRAAVNKSSVTVSGDGIHRIRRDESPGASISYDWSGTWPRLVRTYGGSHYPTCLPLRSYNRSGKQ